MGVGVVSAPPAGAAGERGQGLLPTGSNPTVTAGPTTAGLGASAAAASHGSSRTASAGLAAGAGLGSSSAGLGSSSAGLGSSVGAASGSAVGRGGNGHAGTMAGVVAGISAVAAAAAVPKSSPGMAPVSAYARTERAHVPDAPGRIVMEPTADRPKRLPLIAGGAVAAVLLAGAGWHYAHRAPAAVTPAPIIDGQSASPAPGQGTLSAPASSAPAAPAVKHVEKPSAMVDHRYGGTTAGAHSTSGRANWRVVVFTYNREDQAQHKVAQIAERHGGLRPAVWTPTGRAPYLVTLGGEMTETQAESMRARARNEGLPRDTFARNYKGR